MGVRQGNEFRLICAVAFLALAPNIQTPAHYQEARATVREAIGAYAGEQVGLPVQVAINAGDDLGCGDVYLTMTGTSPEGGDDGATGRGNRITGLIAPFRKSSMEAVAGKNPISHVGKLHNGLALRSAQTIVAELPAVREAEVLFLSQIGRPLDQPQIALSCVKLRQGDLTETIRAEITTILGHQLENVDQLRQTIVAGQIALF